MATPSPPESEHSDDATITSFGPPFDDTDADIILRSSDQVDFMVYKVILSKASPVFKTMFSEPLPQPATGTRDTPQDSRPIIVLAEHSNVLATLLSTIYPPTLVSAGVGPLSLSDHIAVLDMARRYDMAAASCRLLIDFQGSEALRNNHLQAFCVAYGRELRQAAEIAARASVKKTLTLDAIGEELQYISGPAFHILWKFHRACSAVAIQAISGRSFKWIPKRWWNSTKLGHCSGRCSRIDFSLGPSGSRKLFISDSGFKSPPSFVPVKITVNTSWGEYVDRAVDALKTHPCSEAITTQAILLPSFQAEMCDGCRKQIAGLSEFSRYLGEEVDRVVSNVPLDLPF